MIDLYFAIGDDCENTDEIINLNDLSEYEVTVYHKSFKDINSMSGFIDGLKFIDIGYTELKKEEYFRIMSIVNPPQNELIQGFIEDNYPNYSSCDTIASEGDLHKLIFNPDEVEVGDCSWEALINLCPELTEDNWKDWKDSPTLIDKIYANYYDLRCEILEKAIINYVDNN